jgi:hypothetical protein
VFFVKTKITFIATLIIVAIVMLSGCGGTQIAQRDSSSVASDGSAGAGAPGTKTEARNPWGSLGANEYALYHHPGPEGAGYDFFLCFYRDGTVKSRSFHSAKSGGLPAAIAKAFVAEFESNNHLLAAVGEWTIRDGKVVFSTTSMNSAGENVVVDYVCTLNAGGKNVVADVTSRYNGNSDVRNFKYAGKVQKGVLAQP